MSNWTDSGASPGIIARGGINWHTNAIRLDSYKSSIGAHNIALAANSFAGQIGSKNMGSRGDMRTNNETLNGVFGYIDVLNGTVTGSAFATNAQPGTGDTGPIRSRWITRRLAMAGAGVLRRAASITAKPR